MVERFATYFETLHNRCLRGPGRASDSCSTIRKKHKLIVLEERLKTLMQNAKYLENVFIPVGMSLFKVSRWDLGSCLFMDVCLQAS